MCEARSLDIKDLLSSLAHASIATRVDNDGVIDWADAQSLVATDGSTNSEFRVFVRNEEDQVAHVLYALAQDTGREQDAEIGIPGVPIAQGGMSIPRNDICSATEILGEAKDVLGCDHV